MRAVEVTMPHAVLATISPPAILMTGSEMPKKLRTNRPTNRNVTKITKTQTPVLKAVRLRSRAVHADVMVKKMGMPPKGSTMGNSARNVAAAEAGSVRRKWPRAWAEVMLPISFQRLGGAVERGGQRRQLLARGLAVAPVESLVHAGNHDRGIAGIFARRINRMAKPGTVRQSLRREQRALGAA